MLFSRREFLNPEHSSSPAMVHSCIDADGEVRIMITDCNHRVVLHGSNGDDMLYKIKTLMDNIAALYKQAAETSELFSALLKDFPHKVEAEEYLQSLKEIHPIPENFELMVRESSFYMHGKETETFSVMLEEKKTK